jgi:alginate O-acetyltransferase complex protein AlgI
VIVCFTWVFFRAADLPAAVEYCRSMLGLTTPQSGAGLIGGLIYQPYYVVSMLLAAIVVWLCPQTWDFTRTITWRRPCGSRPSSGWRSWP